MPRTDLPTTVVLPDGRTATLAVTLHPALGGGAAPGAPCVLPPLPVVVAPPPAVLLPAAPAVQPPVLLAPAPPAGGHPLFDHPAIGGRLTLFVLCYGDYLPLHRRCLQAVLGTQHLDRLEVRVLGNALGTASREYLQALHASGHVQVLDESPENRKKYPAMRQAFRQPAHPLTTSWLIWFDDDSFCDRRRDWLEVLVRALVQSKDPALGMLGVRQCHGPVNPVRNAWLRAGRWYRGVPWPDRSGAAPPRPEQGRFIHFATGSCWALKTECIDRCDLPDERLAHNGGDICIGAQLQQHGYTIQNWNSDRQLVHWSAAPRRGLSESLFGL